MPAANPTSSTQGALEAQRQTGIACFEAGDYAGCVEAMQQALAGGQKDLVARQYLGDSSEIINTLQQAAASYEAGQRSECVAALKRVLQLNAQDRTATAALATLATAEGGNADYPASAADLGLVPAPTPRTETPDSGPVPTPTSRAETVDTEKPADSLELDVIPSTHKRLLVAIIILLALGASALVGYALFGG